MNGEAKYYAYQVSGDLKEGKQHFNCVGRRVLKNVFFMGTTAEETPLHYKEFCKQPRLASKSWQARNPLIQRKCRF